MKLIQAFQCEFCDKVYKSKSGCMRHEKKCFANPVMRACRSCKYAIKTQETIYVPPQGDQNYGDGDYEVEFITCKITEKVLRDQSECIKRFENGCSFYRQGERLF